MTKLLESPLAFLSPPFLRQSAKSAKSVISSCCFSPRRRMAWRISILCCLLGAGPPRVLRAQVPDPAGCYRLSIGVWSHAPQLSPAQITPPPVFRLDTAAVPNRTAALYAVHPPRLTTREGPNAVWQRVGSDSIRIVWSDGFVGVQLHLEVRQGALVGFAQTLRDAHFVGEPPDPVADVNAVRTACPTGG
jgi:hypothetical protein